jgi:citrate lyase subunit beta / citryl-CoA lyase
VIGIPRSCLFVPAHQDRFVERAHERGADTILLDLEDSVPPLRKKLARSKLAAAVERLGNHGLTVWVRINASLGDCALDLEAACIEGVESIVVPKVRGRDHLELVDDELGRIEAEDGLSVGHIGLIALIETPSALLRASEIALAVPRLRALAFGGEDFSAALGISPEPASLGPYCLQLVLAAKAAGLYALGIPGSIADIDGMEAFSEAAALGKKMGIDGVVCIHPRQISIVNNLYVPSVEDLRNAARIIAAFEHSLKQGDGACMLDGKMIDLPIVRRAEAALLQAAPSHKMTLANGSTGASDRRSQFERPSRI